MNEPPGIPNVLDDNRGNRREQRFKFRTADATMLVMWQANDSELETNEPVLRAICASLTVTDIVPLVE